MSKFCSTLGNKVNGPVKKGFNPQDIHSLCDSLVEVNRNPPARWMHS